MARPTPGTRGKRVLRAAARAIFPAILALCIAADAQQTGPTRPPAKDQARKKDSQIRVQVDLILVPVTVMDPYGRLVTGLEKDNFRIFENGVEQEIQHISSEDAPISAGVIFDMSGSMSVQIDLAQVAATQFLKDANLQDEIFLVTFNDRVREVMGFATKVQGLQRNVMFVQARGRTALLDAIYLGLNMMREAHNPRRALLVISDGEDNNSRYSERDVEHVLREADVQFYSLGSSPAGAWLMLKLSEQTGGRLFGLFGIGSTVERIMMELRNQYVLAYRSSNRTADGKWRKIRVDLRAPRGLPPLHVFARRGYYAPGR